MTTNLPAGYIHLSAFGGGTAYVAAEHISLITSTAYVEGADGSVTLIHADGTEGSIVHIRGAEPVTCTEPPAVVLDRIATALDE